MGGGGHFCYLKVENVPSVILEVGERVLAIFEDEQKRKKIKEKRHVRHLKGRGCVFSRRGMPRWQVG